LVLIRTLTQVHLTRCHLILLRRLTCLSTTLTTHPIRIRIHLVFSFVFSFILLYLLLCLLLIVFLFD
jgi:hypothetical protein